MNEFLNEIETLLASPMGEVRQAPAHYQPNYTEGCKACGGTGKFRSWSGRLVGECFKCKGAGKKTFKSSPEARATAKAKSVEKKAEAAQEKFNGVLAWQQANPEVWAWMQNGVATGFGFAVSLNEALYKWGSLTEGQLNAAKKCVAKLAEAKAAREEKAANAPEINISKIETAFAKARENKIKRPKLNLGSFNFSTAPASGKNAGSIYVKSGEAYLGKVTAGKFYGSRECSEAQEKEILQAASNPSEAAKAYGLRSGNCSCCGRLLTKGISIDLGIGPICAAKYGW